MSHRCSGTTAKGQRCKNPVADDAQATCGRCLAPADKGARAAAAGLPAMASAAAALAASSEHLPLEDADGNAIEDLAGNRPALNQDGTLSLYHATDEQGARAIASTGRWRSEEGDDVFFSTKPASDYLAGFGDHVVEVHLPPHLVHIDDAFRDGEIHFRADLHDLRPEHVVRARRMDER